MKVKISVHVPAEAEAIIREALGAVGAGIIGEYQYCSFTSRGVGRFMPSCKASPHIGEPGVLEEVEESKIEVICEKSNAKVAVEAIKKSHPYEEPAFEITPLIDESEL